MFGEGGVGVVVCPFWVAGKGLDDWEVFSLFLEVFNHEFIFFCSGWWERWWCEDEAYVLANCETGHEEEGCVDVRS